MITLVRIHPVPPLFVNGAEDGMFERASSDDPRTAARHYAYEHGVEVGGSVWIGWGQLPATHEDYDFDLAHMEEWIVTRTYATDRIPDVKQGKTA